MAPRGAQACGTNRIPPKENRIDDRDRQIAKVWCRPRRNLRCLDRPDPTKPTGRTARDRSLSPDVLTRQEDGRARRPHAFERAATDRQQCHQERQAAAGTGQWLPNHCEAAAMNRPALRSKNAPGDRGRFHSACASCQSEVRLAPRDRSQSSTPALHPRACWLQWPRNEWHLQAPTELDRPVHAPHQSGAVGALGVV